MKLLKTTIRFQYASDEARVRSWLQRQRNGQSPGPSPSRASARRDRWQNQGKQRLANGLLGCERADRSASTTRSPRRRNLDLEEIERRLATFVVSAQRPGLDGALPRRQGGGGFSRRSVPRGGRRTVFTVRPSVGRAQPDQRSSEPFARRQESRCRRSGRWSMTKRRVLKSAGMHLLERSAEEAGSTSTDFLRAYYAPEVHPIDTSRAPRRCACTRLDGRSVPPHRRAAARSRWLTQAAEELSARCWRFRRHC